jgi:hypothetical protein
MAFTFLLISYGMASIVLPIPVGCTPILAFKFTCAFAWSITEDEMRPAQTRADLIRRQPASYSVKRL